METINDLFENAARRFSERPALLEPTEDVEQVTTLTYAALQARVQQFAGYLQAQHVQKGERVLIWAASQSNWMAAYLATLRVGAVVVPLDVNTKEDFLARVVDTTEATFLITTRKHYENLKKPLIPLIDIEQLPTETFAPADVPSVQADDLAELVFTSGTTGQPKGVMLSHGNIASNALAALQMVDVSARDRGLSILPLSHMFEATIEIAMLTCGASVLYARTLVPDRLMKMFRVHAVTCMVLVPQALELFMNGIERQVRLQHKERAWNMLHRMAARLPFAWRRLLFREVHRRFGGHFRFFVCGGAYLKPQLAEWWERMGFRVQQGYGTTECAPIISVNAYHDHMPDAVGKVLPGVQVCIAEDREILVKGPNVAQGYWKNPEATQAAFQDGWYHTGDLGYQDEHGFLYIKGRKKNLIVLANGLNVYPEDIENILNSHEAVKDAVVVGLTENAHDTVVHAVLLMEDPAQAKAVIQQTNKQLAAHQQIRGFTIWPETDFPRTHTLKVKRPELLEKLSAVRAHSR